MDGLGRPLRQRRAVGDGGGDRGVRARLRRDRRPGDGHRSARAGPAPTAHDDGSYWTGIVYPDRVHFPAGERTAYTAAAVILAADAITGASAGSRVFAPLVIDDDD